MEKDFKDVVKHISVDRRLGMSKLDVYSMRKDFKETVTNVPEELGKTAGEFQDYVTSPEFKQGVKNTGYAVINTHVGGLWGIAIDIIIPTSGDPEFDEAIRIAGYAQVMSPSFWLDIHDDIDDLKNILR